MEPKPSCITSFGRPGLMEVKLNYTYEQGPSSSACESRTMVPIVAQGTGYNQDGHQYSVWHQQ